MTLYFSRAEPGRLMAVTTVGRGPALAIAALAGGAFSICSAAAGATGSGAGLMSATVAVLAAGVLLAGASTGAGGVSSTGAVATESIAKGVDIACARGCFDASLGAGRAAATMGAAGAIGEGAAGMAGCGAMLRVVNALTVASGSSGGPMRAGDTCNTSRCAARTSIASAASARHGAPAERWPDGMAAAVMWLSCGCHRGNKPQLS